MDAERTLLSKAISTGQVEKLVAKGVDESYFYDDDCKEVWNISTNHLKKFRSSPSLKAVQQELKHKDISFNFEIISDSIDYIYEEFVKQTKRRAAVNGLRDIARIIDREPERMLDIDTDILELGMSLSRMFPSGRASRYSEMEQRIDDYEQRKEQGVIRGIPFGISKLDELTFGIRRHEYVSVVGWQGTGKSTLAQHIAFSGYLAGFTSLIISLEMEANEMLGRFDQMSTNFQTRAIQAMELEMGDIDKWRFQAQRAAALTNDIVVVDDVTKCTVEKIHSLAQQYNSDLLIVDYVSLMDAPKAYGAIWEKVTYLTQGLKQIARDPDCPPVIGIAQTNIDSADSGAKLENISYSRSIGQDSDIVLGLHQDKDGKMKSRNEMEVRMLKNRRGPIADAKMFWNPNEMCFRDWSIDDMFAVVDNGSETK